MLTFKRLVRCTYWTPILLFLLTRSEAARSQACSRESITAKYWQYKENLTRHFMMIDRDELNGCINDGIGQDQSDPCTCSRSGFSLPATSIDQRANGSHGLGDRNNAALYPEWYDPDCAEAGPSPGTDWDNSLVHNVLSVGSETPHQMSWYWITLATEYALLKKNGQEHEAQRTLEDLFLGLQAYRRLDITANCLAKERYDEIQNNFETDYTCAATQFFPFESCLCNFKYTNNIDPEGGTSGCEKANFDIPCNGSDICRFIPQTDGYSGFYIREDATQELEALHDVSEDKWNIDAVQSDHAFSLTPPCTSVFSPACYNVHRQNFMSQDGVIALMVGLAVIKKYIPAEATVTTCDGTPYSPLSIALKIGDALTDRIFDAHNDRIIWPKSDNKDCCAKEVSFSSCEGGHAIWVAKGLKKALSYLDGKSHPSTIGESIGWGLLTKMAQNTNNGNAKFWIRLKSIGWDMGADGDRVTYMSSLPNQNQEIYAIINNLLYPATPNLPIDKSFFEELLCSAPCGGPCKRTVNSIDHTFDCPNTPNWTGQRWETNNSSSNDNRQFNGLDFMALYNLYLLQFPEEQIAYFNPDRPQGEVGLGAGNIGGPDYLCGGKSGEYTVLNVDPGVVQALSWTVSNNLGVINTSGLSATVKHLSQSSGFQFVQASFQKGQLISQHYNNGGDWTTYGNITDICDIIYRKPIHNELPGYAISSEIDHCHASYVFHATPQGIIIPDATFAWTFIVYPEGSPTTTTYTATGQNPSIIPTPYGPIPGQQGFIQARVVVTTTCETQEFGPVFIHYSCSPYRQLIVYPNPVSGGNQANVNITNGYVVPAAGIDVRIIRTSTGTTQSTQRIYNNGAPVSTTGLPPGNYTVRVALEDSSTLTSNLIIN